MSHHIVIPVMNESANVGPLVAEISLLPISPLVITFVDDSLDDLTAKAIAALQLRPGLTVIHHHRTGAQRTGGLAGAVIDGINNAQERGADYIAVMDGDRQHNPVYLIEMFDRLERGFGIAPTTRYSPGGSSEGLDGTVRHLVSRSSGLLARALFPVTLGNVSDPMTGMFAVKADQIDTSRLRAKGFKILLEILVSHPDLTVSEVPMVFRERPAGVSKGTIGRGVDYLQQLMRLRFTHYESRSLLLVEA